MPSPSKMDEELSANMVSEVSGMMGLGKTRCETTIYFEKNKYAPGDNIKFTLECDNSHCKYAVKSFKIKI